MEKDMNAGSGQDVAVIGSGAIGALLAQAAAAAGHRVTLCVRTPIAGLSVRYKGETDAIPVRIVTAADAVSRVDWVVLATKAQDSAGARPWLDRLIGPGTRVVAAQNGVGHAERLAPLVNGAAVVPALAYISTEKIAPGLIAHHSGRRLVVPANEAGLAFQELLADSTLTVEPLADFVTEEWRKLLNNAAANPITALTMRRIGVMTEPDVADLARGLMREAAAVARAEGAQLSDEDVEAMLASFAAVNPEGGSSMFYDRLAGVPLEHQYLTGAVVRAGVRHGVPTPLNRAILTLLDALDRGRGAAG